MSGGSARKPGGSTLAQPAGAATGSADLPPGKRTLTETAGSGPMPAPPRGGVGDASAAEAGQASAASLERSIELAAMRMRESAAAIEEVRARPLGPGGSGKQHAEIKAIYDRAHAELERLWQEIGSLHLDAATKQAIAARTAGFFVAGWRQLQGAHDAAFAETLRRLRPLQDKPDDQGPSERAVGAPAVLQRLANSVLRELDPGVVDTTPDSADPRLTAPSADAEAIALAAAVTAIQDNVRAARRGMASASDGDLLGELARLGAALRRTEVLLAQIAPSRIGQMTLLATALADVEALRGELATRPVAAHALDRSLYALSRLHGRLDAKVAGVDLERHPLPPPNNVGARVLGVRYTAAVVPAEPPLLELLLGAGSDQGIQPEMIGHVVDSGGRRIAHFTVRSVEANQCRGYLKGTPDMLRTATVIINPS